VGLQVLSGKRRTVLQQDEYGDGPDETELDGFQDGVEYHPFLEFRVKVTDGMTRYHMDVEQLHLPSSSFKVSVFSPVGSASDLHLHSNEKQHRERKQILHDNFIAQER
jgi:hypothetical protein